MDLDSKITVSEIVVMPADIPHSVNAIKPFKMLITVVKKPKDA